MVQQLRKSITTLALLVLSGALQAQPSTAPLVLKPDAPERYIVVSGDTLWGISERYTDSPWRWPELWDLNREEIRNPHLIYPGYVILLDRASGRLRLAGTQVPGTVKLGPQVHVDSLAKQQIPSIPSGIIEPFLSKPLVIEPDGLEKAPTIIATESDRVVLASGNQAYVRGIGAKEDETWYVYRKGGPLIDPDTQKTLAYEAIYLGTAQLSRPGDPATVVLTSAVQEVGAGDKLVAAGKPRPVSYAPHAPQADFRGRVISIYGGLSEVGEAGPNSIISINRGRVDGVEVGHVLALYNRGETVRDTTKPRSAPDAYIKLPDERAGLAFVFRVFDRVSYALIMRVTRPVRPLDVVQAP